MAVDSMVSGGCLISGATVRHSLLFSNVCVDDYTKIENTVVLPDAVVGKHCEIKNAIIDKGCLIHDDTKIGVDLEADRDRYHVTPGGVVLVTPEMLGQVLHHVR
jgi:glucose-1-phosphate adenylyltransferase